MNAGPASYKWLLSIKRCTNDQTGAKPLIYEQLIQELKSVILSLMLPICAQTHFNCRYGCIDRTLMCTLL